MRHHRCELAIPGCCNCVRGNTGTLAALGGQMTIETTTPSIGSPRLASSMHASVRRAMGFRSVAGGSLTGIVVRLFAAFLAAFSFYGCAAQVQSTANVEATREAVTTAVYQINSG